MNTKRLWIVLPMIGFLGLLALAAYFWSRGPTYGEVEGRVTRGGVPLEQVEVVFYSEDNGPRSWALTDKEGHFETMTDAIQNAPARKGAPLGKYRVALVDRRDQIQDFKQKAGITPTRAGSRDPKQLRNPALLQKKKKTLSGSGVRVPNRYNQFDTPFHDIEIKPGKNWFDLDVK